MAVTEECRLQKAAVRLRRRIPAVRAAIRKLEEEAGTPLFERSKKNELYLTTAGESLLLNTGIGRVPVLADPFKTIADLYPNVAGGGADVLVGKIERVHEPAIDVSLELRNSCIADADGPDPRYPSQCLTSAREGVCRPRW